VTSNPQMKPLQISVSFFSTIVVTCYYTHNTFYHHLYMLMIIFGILNHELDRKKDNSKNIIHIIDTFLAHLAFVCTLYESHNYMFMNISLFNIFMFFVLEYMYPEYDQILHMMIHVHTVVSMNIYFIYFI